MSTLPATAPVVSARDLSVSYGDKVVLEGVSLSIHRGERVGLVGANGCGKSTFARIVAGLSPADAGEVSRARDMRVAYLPQTPHLEPDLTARQTVLGGLSDWQGALQTYEATSEALARGQGDLDALLARQGAAAAEVERLGGWDRGHQADAMLGHLGIVDRDTPVGTLSGGEQRRVALSRVLVAAPHLAILDQPTNHLDLGTVEWLEQYLADSFAGALLLITHDRYILDRVVQRTAELERGRLFVTPGGYQPYLEAKAERLSHLERTEANRQRFLRQELQWLSRQPKARTTKQKARIQRAEAALTVQAPQAERQVRLEATGPRTGKTILELCDLGLRVGERPLVHGLTFRLTRGQRVGVVGPNGCGKTTLLRAINGELEPAAGQVTLGKNTQVAYLSQSREGLDPQKSVVENVAGKSPTIELGDRSIEIHSYLARFLFTREALAQPVGSLSGGERTRVALARLLSRPANLILMDEPTNDLDVPTLSALEQLLAEFAGTAVVVTHDRYFLDRVVTDILAFEGQGQVVHYPGNYSLYRKLRRPAAPGAAAPQGEDSEAAGGATGRPAPGGATGRPAARGGSSGAGRAGAPGDEQAPAGTSGAACGSRAGAGAGAGAGTGGAGARPFKKRRALTYGEALELEAIMPRIEAAEAAVAELEAELADPALYQGGGDKVPELLEQLEAARGEAEQLMARWEELEHKKAQGDQD